MIHIEVIWCVYGARTLAGSSKSQSDGLQVHLSIPSIPLLHHLFGLHASGSHFPLSLSFFHGSAFPSGICVSTAVRTPCLLFDSDLRISPPTAVEASCLTSSKPLDFFRCADTSVSSFFGDSIYRSFASHLSSASLTLTFKSSNRRKSCSCSWRDGASSLVCLSHWCHEGETWTSEWCVDCVGRRIRRGRAALDTPGGRYSQNVLPDRSEPMRMCRRQGRRRDFQRVQSVGVGMGVDILVGT